MPGRLVLRSLSKTWGLAGLRVGYAVAHPEVASALLRAIARRLRRTNDSMSDLVFSDVPGRVAKQLLDLTKRFGRVVAVEDLSLTVATGGGPGAMEAAIAPFSASLISEMTYAM